MNLSLDKMGIHFICNLCKDTGYVMDMSELHCTCAIGTRCERNDNREVQYVINMTTVEIDSGGIEHVLYDFVHGEYDDPVIECDKCNTTGYISTTPIVYCECPKALYYQGKITEALEMAGGGAWSVYDIIDKDEVLCRDENIEYFQVLPFDENVFHKHAGEMRSIEGIEYTDWQVHDICNTDNHILYDTNEDMYMSDEEYEYAIEIAIANGYNIMEDTLTNNEIVYDE